MALLIVTRAARNAPPRNCAWIAGGNRLYVGKVFPLRQNEAGAGIVAPVGTQLPLKTKRWSKHEENQYSQGDENRRKRQFLLKCQGGGALFAA